MGPKMNSYYKFQVSITLGVYFSLPIWVDASVSSSIAGTDVIWDFFVPWIIEISGFSHGMRIYYSIGYWIKYTRLLAYPLHLYFFIKQMSLKIMGFRFWSQIPWKILSQGKLDSFV